MGRTIIDLTGQRFGKLTVLAYHHKGENRQSHWLCKCDCGKETIVAGNNFKRNNTTSCGCASIEFTKNINLSHGLSRSRIYSTWISMKTRCLNENTNYYKHYGGRGITICDEWVNDFATFNEWAINNGYSEKLSIDRIDNNGNYEPNNCRWSTQKEQANNTRSNRFTTIYGVTKTAAQWIDIWNSESSKIL